MPWGWWLVLPLGTGVAGTQFPEAQRTLLKVICKAIKMLWNPQKSFWTASKPGYCRLYIHQTLSAGKVKMMGALILLCLTISIAAAWSNLQSRSVTGPNTVCMRNKTQPSKRALHLKSLMGIQLVLIVPGCWNTSTMKKIVLGLISSSRHSWLLQWNIYLLPLWTIPINSLLSKFFHVFALYTGPRGRFPRSLWQVSVDI